MFRIGIEIGVGGNSAQALSLLIRQLTGASLAAGHLRKMLGDVKLAAIGLGAVFVGYELGKGLVHMAEHAEKLNHELVKLQIGARLNDAQTAAIGRDAFRVARQTPGTTADDIVKQRRELFGVFGNMETARQLGDMTAQGNVVISRYTDKRLDPQTALKALEISGKVSKDEKVSPELFKESYTAMVRSIVASEGMLTGDDFLKFIKQAGPAARTMSLQALFGSMPEIMIGLGSERSGTAMMSLYQQMVGHVVAGKRTALAMQDAGMLSPGKWRVERGGKVTMDRDAVVNQKEFMDNPVVWLHDRLEAMRKQRDKNGKPLDETRIIQDIFQLSSRATSARLISDIDANWATLQAYLARYKRMPDIPTAAKEQNDKDLKANLDNLSAAWNNFMAALGAPGIPILITVLTKMKDAIDGLSAVVVAHPTIAKYLFDLAAAIAALTVLAGINVTALAILRLSGAMRVLTALMSGAQVVTAATNTGLIANGITALLAAVGSTVAFTAGVAAIVAGIAALVKLGSDAEKDPATAAARERLRKDRGSGSATNLRTHDQDASGIDDTTGLPFAKAPAPSSMPRTPLLWGQRPGHVSYHPGEDGFRFFPPRRPDTAGMNEAHIVNVRVIDGVHVNNGRDIAHGTLEYISRAADRPQAGPTGFDRRGSAWPAINGA